jgi:ureidoglycolate hydrolase
VIAATFPASFIALLSSHPFVLSLSVAKLADRPTTALSFVPLSKKKDDPSTGSGRTGMGVPLVRNDE